MAPANKSKGAVKEVLGAVTGDRHVEAEGRVEQRVAEPESSAEAVTDEAVDKAEKNVKKDHHDVPVEDPNRRAPLGT